MIRRLTSSYRMPLRPVSLDSAALEVGLLRTPDFGEHRCLSWTGANSTYASCIDDGEDAITQSRGVGSTIYGYSISILNR